MKTIKRHVLDYLKSISQAFFFEDPLFGVALLATLLWVDRPAFASAIVSSVVAYVYSVQVSTPRVLKAYGLLPVNGLFFGLAMAHLFVGSPSFYPLIVLGALAVAVVTKAAHEVLQHWKLSPFIAPYLLVVWSTWLCRAGVALQLRPAEVPVIPAWIEILPGFQGFAVQMGWATLQGMARVLFVDNAMFGAALVALIAIFSQRRGLYFLLGTAVGTLTSFVFMGGQLPTLQSFYGFSAGLVGIGLASFPERFRMQTILFFCMLCSVITLAVSQLFGRIDLPVLSLPYVLTLWLAALSRAPRVSVNWAKPGSEA